MTVMSGAKFERFLRSAAGLELQPILEGLTQLPPLDWRTVRVHRRNCPPSSHRAASIILPTTIGIPAWAARASLPSRPGRGHKLSPTRSRTRINTFSTWRGG